LADSPYLDIASQILADMPRRTAHVDDIVNRALETNKNMGLDFDSLKSKITSSLNSAVKRKSGSQFSRVEGKKKGVFRKGVYRLKRVRETPIRPNPPSVKNEQFLGKAGEYAVASELMFHNFNVSLMIVDMGVDLIAEKDNKYFNIQVKTSSVRSTNKWAFTIKLNSFESTYGANTYYAFVVRELRENIFFIIPSLRIKEYLDRGVIKGANTTFSVQLTRSGNGKNWFINNDEDVVHMRDAFDIIQ
jgi:hypothetical protein